MAWYSLIYCSGNFCDRLQYLHGQAIASRGGRHLNLLHPWAASLHHPILGNSTAATLATYRS